MVSCLIFKSLNYFEFSFVCGVRVFSHVDVWQKSTQYCKAIIIQSNINKFNYKKQSQIHTMNIKINVLTEKYIQ